MLTVAVAHVFRNANGCNLYDLHHVCPLAPYLRRRESLYDGRLPKCGPVPLRLREVLQQPDHAVLHLDVDFGLQQRRKVGRERNWLLHDRGGMRVCANDGSEF